MAILDFIAARMVGVVGNNWSHKTCKATVKLSHYDVVFLLQVKGNLNEIDVIRL